MLAWLHLPQMPSPHRLPALLAVVAGLSLATPSPHAAPADPGCASSPGVKIWTAPLEPAPGDPLEILAVATDGSLDQLQISDPGGRDGRLRARRGGGPPWSLHATLFRPTRGSYRIEAVRDSSVVGCTEIRIGEETSDRGDGDWSPAMQAFYAAWIEHLFDDPPEQALSFQSLGPVLRDPDRNLLFGYLGAGEDNQLPAEPDCADLPFFLRAYFAWKLGLPVDYRACSRGSRSSPPRCDAPILDTRFVGPPRPAGSFQELSRRLMDTVHSGSGRTALGDESSDFYPVPLERSALWPGTIYADPYGHVMVLVKWIPQTDRDSGLLLAVDAQPDNSVTRKRFWEGTFLFGQTPSAGPGFKAFRPLVRSDGGGIRILPNAALTGSDGTPPFSAAQAGLSPDDFYARMERLINPDGLDPESAYDATLAALMEQLETRVTSVDNGETYWRAHPGTTIPMPVGPAIFETTGPWEDYATPSRDMRLLIAMKVLDGLPERIRQHPELYALRGESPDAAAARIAQLHARRLDERAISYSRSDGSPWRLTLRDLYDRREALEIAYNPNDCIERRWGATPETPDGASCRRQAPQDQLARMQEYRSWFRTSVRPPR